MSEVICGDNLPFPVGISLTDLLSIEEASGPLWTPPGSGITEMCIAIIE